MSTRVGSMQYILRKVVLHTNIERIEGYLWLEHDHYRVQDVLNDDRGFIPIHKVDKDTGKPSTQTLLINKRYIVDMVEE